MPRKRHSVASVASSGVAVRALASVVDGSQQQPQPQQQPEAKRFKKAAGRLSIAGPRDHPPTMSPTACLLCYQAPAPQQQQQLQLCTSRTAGVVAHYKCMLFASGLPQACDPDEPPPPWLDSSRLLAGFQVDLLMKEARRGGKLRCAHCHRPGATVGCQEARCQRSYHMPCGLEAGSLLIHTGTFQLHCRQHWPRRLGDELAEHLGRLDPDGAELKCPVCLELVDAAGPEAFKSVVHGPCCLACFCHRACAQELANSAGSHFLKCPLCGDTERFRSAMLNQGIEIPCRDASWELEGNAYASHNYRPRLCSHPDCPDPEVDHYGRWLLKICYACGADARHVTCAGMQNGRKRYACETCTRAIAATKAASRSGSGSGSGSSLELD